MAEFSGFETDLQQSGYLGTTVRRAISAAQQRSHRYVTLEHLLLALLDDPDAGELLEGLRVDIAAIKSSAADTVNRNLATLYTPGQFDLRASYKVERVLQTASDDARRLNCVEVDGSFVMAALAREIDSPAADIVKHNGLGFTNAVTWLYANRGAKFSPRSSNAAAGKSAPQPRETPPPVQQSPEHAYGPAAGAMYDEDENDGDLELEIVEDVRTERPAPQADAPRAQPAARPAARPAAQEPPATARDTAPGPAPEAPSRPAAREEGAAPAERRQAPGPVPLPRRQEQGPPDPAMRSKESAPSPAPAQPQREARQPEERSAPRPQPAADETAALASSTAPRRPAPEPKVPPTKRLDEMRVRTPGPAPQPQVSTPPSPPASSKAARKKAASGDAKATPAKRSGQRRGQRPLDVQTGKLVENIPRRMRAASAERVEVRITREETETFVRGLEGRGEPIRHDLLVTSAMTVMLRAPDGGFSIEPLSPETQWIFDGPESQEGDASYGRWRWVVTPTTRGQRRLQVIISARSVDMNGLIGDTVLPEQIITVRVRANIWRGLKRGLEWLIIMALGGAVTEVVATTLRAFMK